MIFTTVITCRCVVGGVVDLSIDAKNTRYTDDTLKECGSVLLKDVSLLLNVRSIELVTHTRTIIHTQSRQGYMIERRTNISIATNFTTYSPMTDTIIWMTKREKEETKTKS